MCGIFGIIINEHSKFTSYSLHMTIQDLFKLSESRGKEAAGLAVYDQQSIAIYKEARAATTLIQNQTYKSMIAKSISFTGALKKEPLKKAFAMMGHSRLVTNGEQEVHDNNQPVVASDLVGIHNGIIVNDEQLWATYPTLKRTYEVDTEVILRLIRKFYDEKKSLTEAIQQTFKLIEGTASIALMPQDMQVLALATNNGSLYTCMDKNENCFIFASEQHILKTLLERPYLRPLMQEAQVLQLKPGTGCLIDTRTAKAQTYSLNSTSMTSITMPAVVPNKQVIDVTPDTGRKFVHTNQSLTVRDLSSSVEKRFSIDTQAIRELKRCTKCLLPETMPFITFDQHGMCNYCRDYKKIAVAGEDALMELANRYRSKTEKPDCIVTFSGGRDSSFGVHYVKNILKMNPITYTYDWGMVTNLARRNQARLCGKLGLEHILVSADITKKRSNIRKNVLAWLKRPNLGTIPLFMAGDKQYFYYANKLREQTGVEIIILCENLLETTGFKSGFCGVQPTFGEQHTYTLSTLNKAKMASFYAKEYLRNPAYINNSVLDTLGAFASYYMIPHDYVNLYDYMMWDEERIMSVLSQEYDWEVATDTQTTWRIGDGTAAFYNYIYYCLAGFTENDTFRSNQIREGMISREQGMDMIYTENQPRFESIQWYCNTIGVDMENTLERIQAAPKLYRK